LRLIPAVLAKNKHQNNKKSVIKVNQKINNLHPPVSTLSFQQKTTKENNNPHTSSVNPLPNWQ